MAPNNDSAGKPVMLMLHGAGSSADIFKIQTHFVAKELSKKYNLVFLDAPTASPPGPGVLPLFADMPAYYMWLTPGAGTNRLEQLVSIAQYIQEQLTAKDIKPESVEAIFGFSQGGMMALGMLGLRLARQTAWDNLRFSVVIGAGTSGNTKLMDGVEDTLGMLSKLLDRDDGKFPGYTVHAAGQKDVWYQDGRRLATFCDADTTRVIDYREGHVVPRKRPDVNKLLEAINAIDEASKAQPPAKVAPDTKLLESLPPMVEGDNVHKGIEMLAAEGIKV